VYLDALVGFILIVKHQCIVMKYLKLTDNHFCSLTFLRERDHWGDPDVDGRIILRWMFRKWEGVVGTGWSWLRTGRGGGHL
jgi:hypothetical protein